MQLYVWTEENMIHCPTRCKLWSWFNKKASVLHVGKIARDSEARLMICDMALCSCRNSHCSLWLASQKKKKKFWNWHDLQCSVLRPMLMINSIEICWEKKMIVFWKRRKRFWNSKSLLVAHMTKSMLFSIILSVPLGSQYPGKSSINNTTNFIIICCHWGSCGMGDWMTCGKRSSNW